MALTRKSLALAVETVGPDHANTASSHVRLGRMLTVEKQYASAEQHLLHAHAIRSKVLGPDARPTQETVALLDKLYAAWGKPEKAKALASGTGK